MSVWDKIKNTIIVPDEDYYEDQTDEDIPGFDEQDSEPEASPLRRTARGQRRTPRAEEDGYAQPSSLFGKNARARDDKVVDIHTTAKLQVVLRTPQGYNEDAKEIADDLNEKRTVVLNLEKCDHAAAMRLVDFLTGVAYANGGKPKRIAQNIVIITPYNVDVMGDLLDDLENSGYFFG